MDRIWHTVTIEPDCNGRRGEQAISRELDEEIEAWIIEHVVTESECHGIWKNTHFLIYAFTSEEIAMAFKLRWS